VKSGGKIGSEKIGEKYFREKRLEKNHKMSWIENMMKVAYRQSNENHSNTNICPHQARGSFQPDRTCEVWALTFSHEQEQITWRPGGAGFF
jgi:hypothetical protein